jgi:ATP-dependent DNA ligase
VTLPLAPTIDPQLAKTATELPPEGGWVYEPKWDGFRVIAFVDGDEVFLQSRNGKPLDRYFPELSLPPGRYVLDGEIVVDPGDGSQDFGALQQRIHPAASRVELLSRETPASIVAFDLLAEGDEVLLERPFAERRAALERLLADVGGHPVSLTPQETTSERAERWLDTAEGVIAKQTGAPYVPGKRLGMLKVRRRRTLDSVVCGYRPGTEPDTIGSLILALYGHDGKLVVVGHCSAFTRAEKREALERVRPFETGERGAGEASRWTAGRELEWVELRPEIVVEVSYDHVSGGRIRHGTRLVRWRDDRDPKSCSIDQLV